LSPNANGKASQLNTYHNGDSLDVYELLNYFANGFEYIGTGGMWKHFANDDSTYTTALAVYALCDLFNDTNVLDFFKVMYFKIMDVEEKNRKLTDLNSKLKNNAIKALWERIRDSKVAAFIANYSAVIQLLIPLLLLFMGLVWWFKDAIMQIIGTHK
jgi:hypothetical protein